MHTTMRPFTTFFSIVSLAVYLTVGTTTEAAEVKYRDLITKEGIGFNVDGAVKVDAAGAKALFDRGVVFIDSRRSDPYFSGHIPGATNLIRLTKKRLSKLVGLDQEVAFYCAGEDCELSANACAKALTWGYTKVYYFAGGYPAWKAAGYPVDW